MNWHPRLIQAIEETIAEFTTCEESYYSASALEVDQEKAQKILAVFINHLACEYYMRDIEEHILPRIEIDNILDFTYTGAKLE